jgi:hypothetical protein
VGAGVGEQDSDDCCATQASLRQCQRGSKTFEDVALRFQEIPGLRTKCFVGRTRIDGVYIWEDRVAGEGYLTPAWSDQMAKSFGAVPKVTHLDVRCVVDNTIGEI